MKHLLEAEDLRSAGRNLQGVTFCRRDVYRRPDDGPGGGVGVGDLASSINGVTCRGCINGHKARAPRPARTWK